MLIKEFKRIATNAIRKDALTITEAGYESISIPTLLKNKVVVSDSKLKINSRVYDLDRYRRLYVVGVGKSSGLIAQELENQIGADKITAGVVIDLKYRKLKKIKVFSGSHPLPSEQNIRATNKLIQILKLANKKDLVIAIICGGGSSLACLPAKGLVCEDLQSITDHLLKSGAKISEINIIRRHISGIHGGNMAKLAYPASVLGLVVSDVPGESIDIVASGPISKDETSIEDAAKIAKKYKLQIHLMETPKDNKYFKKVNLELLADGYDVLNSMVKKAKALGYKSRIYSSTLTGLASKVGPELAKAVKPGEALLSWGETQVIITHPGKGGRNQDLVLSALPYLSGTSAIVSAASDGKDNINVAGAIADSKISLRLANQLKIDPEKSVKQNSSYKALKKLNSLFHIQKITANISDFVVVLKAR